MTRKPVALVSEVISGTGMPQRLEIRTPTVINMFMIVPKGPFSSVGAISLMKLG